MVKLSWKTLRCLFISSLTRQGFLIAMAHLIQNSNLNYFTNCINNDIIITEVHIGVNTMKKVFLFQLLAHFTPDAVSYQKLWTSEWGSNQELLICDWVRCWLPVIVFWLLSTSPPFTSPTQAVHTCADEPALSQSQLVITADAIMKRADFLCCRDSFLEVTSTQCRVRFVLDYKTTYKKKTVSCPCHAKVAYPAAGTTSSISENTTD